MDGTEDTMIGTEADETADISSTSQLEYRLRSSSCSKAALGRPENEPGVKLRSLDGGEVPKSSKLADDAGEAVSE